MEREPYSYKRWMSYCYQCDPERAELIGKLIGRNSVLIGKSYLQQDFEAVTELQKQNFFLGKSLEVNTPSKKEDKSKATAPPVQPIAPRAEASLAVSAVGDAGPLDDITEEDIEEAFRLIKKRKANQLN